MTQKNTVNYDSQLKKEIEKAEIWLSENTGGNEMEFIKKARHRNDLLCKLNLSKPRKVISTVGVEYIIPKN